MGSGASVAQRFVLTPTEFCSPQLISFDCADTVIDSSSGSDSDMIVVLDSPLLSPLTDPVFEFEPASIQSPSSYIPPLSQDLPHYEDWLAEARISSPAVSTSPFTSGHGTPPTPEWELDLRFQRELEMQSFYNGQPLIEANAQRYTSRPQSDSGSDSDVIVVLDLPLLSSLTDPVFDFDPASIQSPSSYVPPLSQDLPHYEDWLAEAKISSPAVSTSPFTSGHGTPPTPEWELDLRFQRELEMQSFYNGQP